MFQRTPSALFIVGHQRSGTSLLFRLLRDSTGARPFDEDNAEAFVNFRLKEPECISNLITLSGHSCIFKPISQTISFLEILDGHPNSKAVFIYRNPLDVVMSCVLEFQANAHGLARELTYNYTRNRLKDVGVTLTSWHEIDAVLDRYRGRFSPSSNSASMFALNWLLLHTALVQRRLIIHPDVVIVRYEDLVESPGKTARILADRLGIQITFPDRFRRDQERHFFRDQIDVQLARDCMNLFQMYQDSVA
jgi:hypothetical protein